MQIALFTLLLPVASAFVTPAAIWGNSCVRANRDIYCLGGVQQGPTISNKIYHLDISTSWETSSPPWTDISIDGTDNVGLYSAFAGAATLSDHNSILVNGGAISTNLQDIANTTAVFDTRTNTWSRPGMSGTSMLPSRYHHSLVSDDQGRTWIWGGQSVNEYFNTWAVIDTTAWTVSYPNIVGAPAPRVQHTATLVPEGKIIITGGLTYTRNVTDPTGGNILNPVSMADILLFDPSTAKWTNLTAGGNIPAPRRDHSAVLSHDSSSLVVFGGGDPMSDNSNMNDVFVLNLSSLLWSSPSISNMPPPPRKSHQETDERKFNLAAILVKNQMLVMFGYDSDGNAFNDLHILDTSSWTWDTHYRINDDPKSTEPASSSNDSNKSNVLGGQSALISTALWGSIVAATFLVLIRSIFRMDPRSSEQVLPAALVISQKPDIEQEDIVHKPNEHEADGYA
ncbi:hypothetical protein INT43_004424 [Umbelopsis isabellina]|uniref:Galactose oxidase n=1 Tax=Mortierella isabellina TaxID=91625 RepID=A0A8H7PI85_MORIS|nr:hypothetical protein INT43_004424 [Umbelopsis isabellina]